MRTQMRAVNIEFFCVANNRPIRCYRLAHHAKLDKCAEFANHKQSLFHCCGMPGRLDIHIATITLCQFMDFVNHIHRVRV